MGSGQGLKAVETMTLHYKSTPPVRTTLEEVDFEIPTRIA